MTTNNKEVEEIADRPEKEIEKLAGGFESWHSFYSGLTITQEVEQDTTKLYEQYLIEYNKDALSTLLSSRDTYWKERVRKIAREIEETEQPTGTYDYQSFVLGYQRALDTLLENLTKGE